MSNATSSRKAEVTLPGDDQILITRDFDAPKHLVWKAFTTPELVARWWSGHRGRTTSAEIDLRVGGKWRYVMEVGTGPAAGAEIAFHGEYREVVPNERLVSTEVFEQIPDDYAVNTMTLSEVDGVTRMEVLVQHNSKEARDGHINSGMEGGMQEAMDLLEEIAISLA
jgi:uncharacterized protein YndB with AHSA1/START domain